MQILCVGDLAPADQVLPEQPWPVPAGFAPGPDQRILFNWELPLGSEINTRPRTSGPRLLVKPESVQVIKHWAPGIATLATNHILDGEGEGLKLTIDSLCQAGFETVGAGMDADAITRPVYWSTGEGTVAIINWVFPETHPDWKAVPGPNCWPGPEEAARSIQHCKTLADWVMVIVHWSDENFLYPQPEDRETARLLVQSGADVIIGHHSHVVRGSEVIDGCPVFYGLGNFYFADIRDRNGRYTVQMSPWNHEGLGVLVRFQHGCQPQCQAVSFIQKGSLSEQDRAGRAAQRMESTSAVLNKIPAKAYREWHQRTRARFMKWTYPWQFGVRKIGLRGLIPYILGKARRLVR